WPPSKEQLKIANCLVKEQLDAGHIQPFVSPWNTPIFVVPKKTGKGRILQDLRKVNNQMWPMGALQPGLPLLTMLPRGWHLLVIDLKDCFFNIPLHPEDTARFAFTIPSVNKSEPAKHYEWVVLPQGMKNSPTICQMYVAWALSPIHKEMPETLIYHYMDDILFCQEAPFPDNFSQILTNRLKTKGLIVAPEKVQTRLPWSYLGWQVTHAMVRPQKLEVISSIKTLNNAQKLVGELRWVRPIIGLTNADIHPFLSLL
ncbi:Putative Pol polyprotein, partial [Calypte anna]